MLELYYIRHDQTQMLLQMEKFEKSLESVQRSFSTIRTGRATPTMLDRVQVGIFGGGLHSVQLKAHASVRPAVDCSTVPKCVSRGVLSLPAWLPAGGLSML